MNYKPFDLQKALSGEPVVTDKGHRAIYRFTAVNESIKHHHVFSYVDDKVREWVTVVNNEGLSSDTGSWVTNPAKLFMAPQKKTVWVNIFSKYSAVHNATAIQATQHPHEDEKTAKECRDNLVSNGYAVHATVPIEIEL
jgi:hypothetical protein